MSNSCEAGVDADATETGWDGRRADLKTSRTSCCKDSGIGGVKSIGDCDFNCLPCFSLLGLDCFAGWRVRGWDWGFALDLEAAFLRSPCFGGMLAIISSRYYIPIIYIDGIYIPIVYFSEGQ